MFIASSKAGTRSFVSYAVSARTREIGIRMALGAHSTNVRALIVWQGMLLTSLGLAIALAACYGPARRATRINPIATLRAE